MGSATRTTARMQARITAKVQTNAKAPNTRHKAAARRTSYRRAGPRNRLLLAGISVAIVIALVATLIAVKLSQVPAISEIGRAHV